MSAPDSDDVARREEALVDTYLRHHFGVEPTRPVSTSPAKESDEPDEDQQFAAYMRRHFPGRKGQANR